VSRVDKSAAERGQEANVSYCQSCKPNGGVEQSIAARHNAHELQLLLTLDVRLHLIFCRVSGDWGNFNF